MLWVLLARCPCDVLMFGLVYSIHGGCHGLGLSDLVVASLSGALGLLQNLFLQLFDVSLVLCFVITGYLTHKLWQPESPASCVYTKSLQVEVSNLRRLTAGIIRR